tara:strand:+ start:1458 stop:2495 length:1038 start_codon:yes stop_codon:yes gene_type:complete
MSKKNKLRIGVIGATGYTGLELILLLSKHPNVKIKYLCATKNLGKKISYFDKRIVKKMPNISSVKKIKYQDIDLLFLSLPNGEAQKIIKKNFFKYPNLKFIDLSADFRLQNAKNFNQIYKINHYAKNLIRYSLYSLAELTRNQIKRFRIIANPGCYSTSIQLPLVPLIKKKLIDFNNITIDSKSGYSGAGKKFEKKFTHKNLYNSTYAYSIKHHRHISEIDQEFTKLTSQKVKYTFNPHLLPTFKGILSSIYIRPKKGISAKKIRNELINFYKKSRFIKILKLNSELGSGNVLGTNNCEISICETRLKDKIIIFSAIDNLVKGASGQAVQNMNLLFNYNESTGLL